MIMVVVVYIAAWNSQEFASESIDDSRDILQQETVGVNKAGLAWLLSYDMETWIAQRIENVRSWARDGAVINAAKEEADSASARLFLGDEIIGMPDFADAYVVNLTGDLVTQEISYDQPDIESDGASWRLGKEQGLYVGNLYMPKEGFSNVFSMDIAVLMDDLSTGDPLGVLVGVVKVHPSSLVQEYELKVMDHRIMVFDRNGMIIANTDSDNRFLEVNPVRTDSEQQVLNRITEDAVLIEPNYVINDDVVAGYARATNDSVNMRIPGFDGLGWTVMVEQDADTAFAALESMEQLEKDLDENTRNALFLSIVIFAAVAISVLGLAFWISRIFTKPILKLHQGVQEVIEGNLDYRLGSEAEDEIGDLSRVFDEMAATIKWSQEDLRDYSMNLEQKVVERTDELQKELFERKQAEAKLKEQTSMLIQSEKMKSMGTMVAGVAHELNNPMTGIINYAQHCIKHTEETDRKYPVLKDIEKEARRCANIIWNLVTFARMEAEGEESYHMANIATLVDRVIMLSAHRTVMDSVTITQHFDEGIPDIPVKATELEQMIFNIFSNAMDAMKDTPKKEIHVEGKVNGDFVELVISDTGKGIAPENLVKIFDPFYTTKTVGEGTGLGLSVCQSICRQHGGVITCESEVGVGTKFIIQLSIGRENINQEEN